MLVNQVVDENIIVFGMVKPGYIWNLVHNFFIDMPKKIIQKPAK
jgi:hypothetical protein